MIKAQSMLNVLENMREEMGQGEVQRNEQLL